MKKLFAFVALAGIPTIVSAQCDTTYINENKTITADEILSGVYYIDGNFTINTDITVFVAPYNSGSCGKLEIHAKKINIKGNINGDYAGYPGGNGGNGGNSVNSVTGDQNALTSCSNKDNAGRVEVEGGKNGTPGIGTGGGLSGLSGTNGSGPKQVCGSSADTYGMIAGSGGAGGGGGASYGGNGTSGTAGGNGSLVYNATGVPVSTQYLISNGTGGGGGGKGQPYGTQYEPDIDLGSGGAGAGGGGRSYEIGMNGLRGGNGGGLIILKATQELLVSGDISVNGEDGKNGGQAGSGGASSKCCSDLCDDCGEATFSTGAGAGSGSGAGSGGGILLESGNSASVTGLLSAQGGKGGGSGTPGSGITCNYSATFCGSQSVSTGNGGTGGIGGDGSGGRIKLFIGVCSQTSTEPVTHLSGGGTAEAGTYAKICNSHLTVNAVENVQFSIYPNPVEDIMTIAFINAGIVSEGFLSISNTLGQQLLSREIQGEDQIHMNLSDFQSGIYLLNIELNGQVSSVKIIKK